MARRGEVDLRILGSTDIGKVRKTNQDDYASGILPGGAAWVVVCDGMGGTNGGSVASTTAVRLITDSIIQGYTGDNSPPVIKELLISSVNTANKGVYDLSRSDEELNGMGTTVVAGIVTDEFIHIAHAGDSRAYILSESNIAQLTRDHSIVQEMVESGDLTPEEAKTHPQKNIITRALGIEQTLDIDYREAALEDGQALLLCTDGLSNCVDEQVVLKTARECGFESCPKNLIDIANENGGIDNITVVVIFK
jgi:protein phosphatase